MQNLTNNNLYRKYRPKNFKEIVGQNDIITLLKNSIFSKNINNAYIFSGPRGIGKTSIARIFSKVINCLKPIDNDCCNQCENCLLINDNRTPDFVEIDAASNNSVNDVRQINDNISYLPVNLKYKIYIIDEAHMLTTSAWNAFLKILEETPNNVIFIFATTEFYKIPLTILSRCQKYSFQKIAINELVGQIKKVAQLEKIIIDDDSAKLIARLADGSLRDDLSLLDQVNVFCNSKVSLEKINQIFGLIDNDKKIELIKNIQSLNYSNLISLINEFEQKGIDFYQLSFDLVKIFLDKYIYEKTKNKNLLNFTDYSTILEINIQPSFLNKIIEIFNDAILKMKRNLNHKFFFELACIESMKIFDFNKVNIQENNLINQKIINERTIKKQENINSNLRNEDKKEVIKDNEKSNNVLVNEETKENIEEKNFSNQNLDKLIEKSIKVKSVKLNKVKSLFKNNIINPKESFNTIEEDFNSSINQNLFKNTNNTNNANNEENTKKVFESNHNNDHNEPKKVEQNSKDVNNLQSYVENSTLDSSNSFDSDLSISSEEKKFDQIKTNVKTSNKQKSSEAMNYSDNLFSINNNEEENDVILFGKPKNINSKVLSTNMDQVKEKENSYSFEKTLIDENGSEKNEFKSNKELNKNNVEIFCKIAFNRNNEEKNRLNSILDTIKNNMPMNAQEGIFVDADKIILSSNNGFVVLYNSELDCNSLNSMNENKEFLLFIKKKFGRVFKVIGVSKEDAINFTEKYKNYINKGIRLSDISISNLLARIENNTKKVSDKELAMELLGDLIEE